MQWKNVIKEGIVYQARQYVSEAFDPMIRVTPGRGPYKGQMVFEVFTGTGRFVIVEQGNWIICDNNGSVKRYYVINSAEFERDFNPV